MNAVGKNIKKLRIARKMTQEDLADKMFVTRQTISNWETGKSQPDLETLSAISRLFSVEPTELIYGIRPSYKLFQKRYIITAAISFCVFIISIILEFTLYPHLIEIRKTYFRGVFEIALYTLIVRPLGFFALGVSIISVFSFWIDTRLEKRARIIALIIGIILLVFPLWLLIETILMFKAPQGFPGSVLFLPVNSSQYLLAVFNIVMPLLSGIGMFMGWKRK